MGTTLAKDLIVELVKRAMTRAEVQQQGRKSAGEVVVEQVPDAQPGLPLLRVTRLSRQGGGET